MSAGSLKRLDEATIATFRRDGVCLLPQALDAQALGACESAWQWSRTHPGPLAGGMETRAAVSRQDLCHPDALGVYEDVVRNAPLADYAQALWPSDRVWFMYEQIFHKTGGLAGRTPWHQDTSYLAVTGDHLIAFWVSFEAIPEDKALEFVRASHRGTLHNTSRFAPDDPTLPIYPSEELPRLPDIEAQRDAYDIVRFATRPGDVIAFHTSTLHGGGATDATTPERRTLTLRFFGDDARSAARPGPAGPFYDDIKDLRPGAPFRHPRFLQVR